MKTTEEAAYIVAQWNDDACTHLLFQVQRNGNMVNVRLIGATDSMEDYPHPYTYASQSDKISEVRNSHLIADTNRIDDEEEASERTFVFIRQETSGMYRLWRVKTKDGYVSDWTWHAEAKHPAYLDPSASLPTFSYLRDFEDIVLALQEEVYE